MEEVDFDWHDRLPIDFTMDMLIVEADHYFKPFVEGREDELSGSISALLNLPKPSMADYLASYRQARFGLARRHGVLR